MDKVAQYLISKDNGQLQIPYGEYVELLKKADESKRIHQVRDEVLADLEAFLGGDFSNTAVLKTDDIKESDPTAVAEIAEVEEEDAPREVAETAEEPVAEKEDAGGKPVAAKARKKVSNIEVPPIKKEIAAHFNKLDESGRFLNVFRQYYTCLNDNCGGTVRVTMKDGFCSLWNYDEWEEFAFVDIFEGNLRFAVDPRYAEALSALSTCEVPRLLSSRRNLICVQVGDLNNTMLNVLATAFEEVGMAAS